MSLKYLKITLKTNHIPAEFFSLHFFSALVQLLWLAAVTVDSHNIHQFNVLFQNCTKPLSIFYHLLYRSKPLNQQVKHTKEFQSRDHISHATCRSTTRGYKRTLIKLWNRKDPGTGVPSKTIPSPAQRRRSAALTTCIIEGMLERDQSHTLDQISEQWQWHISHFILSNSLVGLFIERLKTLRLLLRK